MDYVIATDSTCDLPKTLLREMQVQSLDMMYFVNDIGYGKDDANQLEFHEFYDAMRNGARTSTSMINEQTAREFLTDLLEQGTDVLTKTLNASPKNLTRQTRIKFTSSIPNARRAAKACSLRSSRKNAKAA